MSNAAPGHLFFFCMSSIHTTWERPSPCTIVFWPDGFWEENFSSISFIYSSVKNSSQITYPFSPWRSWLKQTSIYITLQLECSHSRFSLANWVFERKISLKYQKFFNNKESSQKGIGLSVEQNYILFHPKLICAKFVCKLPSHLVIFHNNGYLKFT